MSLVDEKQLVRLTPSGIKGGGGKARARGAIGPVGNRGRSPAWLSHTADAAAPAAAVWPRRVEWSNGQVMHHCMTNEEGMVGWWDGGGSEITYNPDICGPPQDAVDDQGREQPSDPPD